eukprot:COSAG01_NODE_4_length_55812_cov_1344.168109_19_plen_405_part_00
MLKSYLCVYLDHHGDLIQTQQDFVSSYDARYTISKISQKVLFVKPVQVGVLLGFILPVLPAPSTEDLIGFTYFLSNSLKIGYSLVDSLSLTLEQLKNKRLFFAVGHILMLLKEGRRFSDGLSMYPNIFPLFYSAVVKTGESSGNLANVLDALLQYMEKKHCLYQDIRQALFYPLVLFIVLFALSFIIIYFVAPKFRVFLGADANFPLPSRILFALADFFSSYTLHLFFSFFIFFLFFYLISRIKSVAVFLSFLLLKIPGVGPLVQSFIVFRFLKVLDVLLSSHIVLSESFALVAQSIKHAGFYKMFIELQQALLHGKRLSFVLFSYQAYLPSLVFFSLSVGEKSGLLSKMVSRLAIYSDQQISHQMKSFFSKFNPLLTLILGALVVFLSLAIYLPIFSMITSVM